MLKAIEGTYFIQTERLKLQLEGLDELEAKWLTLGEGSLTST